MAGRGHRHVALLIQRGRYGGDRESEIGFAEGVEAAQRRGVSGMVLHHDGSSDGVCRQLDVLLQKRPRTTALLIARSGFALTALTHLQRCGVRVPGDMALLCRDDDRFLDQVVPRMARYAVAPAAFAKQVCRVVKMLVQDGHAADADVKVMPSFTSRESL